MTTSVSSQLQPDFIQADECTKVWKELWANRDIAWHLNNRNPTLVMYDHKLMDGRDGPATILFPFCGKAIDMAYYYRNGHTVIGVECSKEGIVEFFDEQQLEYDRVLMSNGSDYFYATKDRKLIIFNTNFFRLDDEMVNGKINVVWDRGALTAVDGVDQELYINKMRQLLADDFRYLLLVVEYDQSQWKSVPYSKSEELVRRLYGWANDVEKLRTWLPDHKRLYHEHMKNPLMEVKETAYLITGKRD